MGICTLRGSAGTLRLVSRKARTYIVKQIDFVEEFLRRMIDVFVESSSQLAFANEKANS